MSVQDKLDKILLRVEKPARYIGGEPNSILKETDPSMLRWAFCFPDMYEIGMSFLGMQILYFTLNKSAHIYCERVFTPAKDMQAEMEKEGVPLFTLETKTPLKEMDIVGFTLQYELSYSNVLLMLKEAGIPLRAADRSENDPIIVAGGPCAFNSEPLAEFFDAIMVGDGENQIMELSELAWKRKNSGQSKEDYLKELINVPGVYVPSFYKPVYDEKGTFTAFKKLYDKAPDRVLKCIENDMDALDFPTEHIIPLMDAVYDRATVEIFRGCTRGCRFCQAGMLYRPVRERSIDNIVKLAKDQLASSGHGELSLLSLSSSDYSQFNELAMTLLDYCSAHNVSLSLPSLRLDNMGFKVMDAIKGARKTGLTFAVEAGTQRLRDVINKNVWEEDIFKALGTAMDLGWNAVKLYLMIGLPTETDEDLDGMVELAKKIMDLAYFKGKRGFKVNLSVANFVPKPYTPFQWVPQDTPEEFERKHYYLKDRVRNIKGVTLHYHGSYESHLEAIFARGGRELSKTLELAVEKGCCFDSWTEGFKEDAWKEALAESGIGGDYYGLRGLPLDAALPWSVIDAGITEEFLLREYKKSVKAETTEDCRHYCNGCGINRYVECRQCGVLKDAERTYSV